MPTYSKNIVQTQRTLHTSTRGGEEENLKTKKKDNSKTLESHTHIPITEPIFQLLIFHYFCISEYPIQSHNNTLHMKAIGIFFLFFGWTQDCCHCIQCVHQPFRLVAQLKWKTRRKRRFLERQQPFVLLHDMFGENCNEWCNQDNLLLLRPPPCTLLLSRSAW